MNLSKASSPVVFIILAIILPALAVYFKYEYFAENLPSFSLAGIAAKAILLAIIFCSAYFFSRKNKDEDLSLRTLFRNMFILALIGEAFIALMDYLCMFQLDPGFIDQFYNTNKIWLDEHSNWPQDRKDQALQDIINIKNVSTRDMIQSYLLSVITSSIFAFIFAFIIRTLHAQNARLRKYYQNS